MSSSRSNHPPSESDPSPDPLASYPFRRLLRDAIADAQRKATSQGQALSVNEIERQAGIGQGTLSRVLSGKRRKVHLETIKRLSVTLAIPERQLAQAIERELGHQAQTKGDLPSRNLVSKQREAAKKLIARVWLTGRHTIAAAYSVESVLEKTTIDLTQSPAVSLGKALLDLASLLHDEKQSTAVIERALSHFLTTWHEQRPPADRPRKTPVAA